MGQSKRTILVHVGRDWGCEYTSEDEESFCAMLAREIERRCPGADVTVESVDGLTRYSADDPDDEGTAREAHDWVWEQGAFWVSTTQDRQAFTALAVTAIREHGVSAFLRYLSDACRAHGQTHHAAQLGLADAAVIHIGCLLRAPDFQAGERLAHNFLSLAGGPAFLVGVHQLDATLAAFGPDVAHHVEREARRAEKVRVEAEACQDRWHGLPRPTGPEYSSARCPTCRHSHAEIRS